MAQDDNAMNSRETLNTGNFFFTRLLCRVIAVAALVYFQLNNGFVFAQPAANARAGTSPKHNVWGTFTQNQTSAVDHISPSSHPHCKGVAMIMSWDKLQPAPDRFEFESLIKNPLTALSKHDYHAYLMVWVAPDRTPEWVFSTRNVPKVMIGRRTNPAFLNPHYKACYFKMIESVGQYLCNLPPDLKARILFVQSAEGSTGDEGPYHGTPDDPKYEISKEVWAEFRRETWQHYVAALTVDGRQQFPLLINAKDNDFEDLVQITKAAIGTNKGAVGVKEGGLTHAYHAAGEASKMNALQEYRRLAASNGLAFFCRGEWNKDWQPNNMKQGLYWLALMCLHSGITMWNMQMDTAQGHEYDEAKLVFNKYAGALVPQESDGAFCALRAIAKTFSCFGAVNGDTDAALKVGVRSRRAERENDCTWEQSRGNWQLHINQIEENTTSDGYWNVDETIYGRFARGFKPGTKAMYFNLDDKFFGDSPLNGRQSVAVSVIYRNADEGKWQLKYDATDGTMKTAFSVENTVSGDVWRTKTAIIKDGHLGNGGPKGADFVIESIDGKPCRFHMIAVDKIGK